MKGFKTITYSNMAFIWAILLPLFAVLGQTESRSFVIDYENDCFLKDGEPFRYISGSFHYFRVPSFYWRDRLMKMKAGGLNAVQTCVAWNIHEPVYGQYNFEGDADIVSFIELANSLGLLVIVRAGPYICAEWEFGGFPAWLLKNTSISLRSMESKEYIMAVENWMGVLLPRLKPLLYDNGGPIISVQVENEYGSFPACDHAYMELLAQLFRYYLGNNVILFTVDGDAESYLQCGTVSSLYATVDFGPKTNPESAFAVMRKFSPRGPLVNTEFYAGWLDNWGEPHQMRSATSIANTLDKILSMNASVNFYMYEGGTNFGFMNGAQYSGSVLHPNPTSYDYDAPLTEAGDTTTKFMILRETISKHEAIPVIPIPANTTKFAYGKVQMTQISTFLDLVPKLAAPYGPVNATFPLTMEQIEQNYGFVLYRTEIPKGFAQSTVTLSFTSVARDRAIIYVGRVRQATLYRNPNQTEITLHIGEFLQLDILVENVGRINYGPSICDPKGIVGNVTINGNILTNWQIYPINLANVVSNLTSLLQNEYNNNVLDPFAADDFAPSFFHGEIPPNPKGNAFDTFLQLPGWSKGQAFVNGFNLGRYWPVVGPQETLFVPASVLSPNQQPSSLVLLELDGAPCEFPSSCFVEFVASPSINGTVHPID